MEDKKVKILLIENDPGDTRLINEWLEEVKFKSFNLKCCERLDAGLRLLAKDSFDVTLLDLELPDSQGIETFIKVQAASPLMPVVVLSDEADESLAVDTLQKGAQDYLIKGVVGSDSLYRIIRFSIERKRAQETVRRGKEETEKYLNIAGMMIATINADGNISMINKKGCEILGYQEEELLGKGWIDVTVPERDRARVRGVFRKLMAGIIKPFEYYENPMLTKNGEERDIAFHNTVLKDSKGKINGVLFSAEDITERKRTESELKSSLEEKEVLLKEIHHRVKNNMQIIYSLLSLQSRYIQDKNILNMIKESHDRIKSMALIHERLYQSKDLARINFGDYIRKLTLSLLYSYGIGPDDIELKINVDSVSLEINMAIPCGLIINELVSNSLKYAFPEDKGGEIRIDLRSNTDVSFPQKNKPQKTNNYFTLIVSDDGVGIPKNIDFRKVETLGLQLVITLVEQLEGHIRISRKKGTSFRITFSSLGDI